MPEQKDTLQDRNAQMLLFGNLIKGILEGEDFLLVVQRADNTLDFVAADKDAVSLAVKFIEIIEKEGNHA